MQADADAKNNGFIDAHVHVSSREGIDSALAAGIAALRNAGRVMNDDARNARPDCIRSEQDPVVRTSCWALYKPNGYGGRFGAPTATRDEMQKEIYLLKNSGADIIKVMASGLVSLRAPGTVTAGGFDANELRFIVEEAGGCGLGVMAHANGEEAILAAAEAGVRSIEHGFFMSARALEAMARKGTWWVPTAGALTRAAAGKPLGAHEFVTRLLASHGEHVLQAHAEGIPLAIGTDCVLPDPGYRAYYEAELAFFEQAGIPHDAVMKIARENGARLLGI